VAETWEIKLWTNSRRG